MLSSMPNAHQANHKLQGCVSQDCPQHEEGHGSWGQSQETEACTAQWFHHHGGVCGHIGGQVDQGSKQVHEGAHQRDWVVSRTHTGGNHMSETKILRERDVPLSRADAEVQQSEEGQEAHVIYETRKSIDHVRLSDKKMWTVNQAYTSRLNRIITFSPKNILPILKSKYPASRMQACQMWCLALSQLKGICSAGDSTPISGLGPRSMWMYWRCMWSHGWTASTPGATMCSSRTLFWRTRPRSHRPGWRPTL